MDTNDLLQRVRRVEIKTKALTNNIFAGEYHSAFKGRGMSFAEVREYQTGDDVRDIDWNVTARLNRPHIKVFEEERELTVMLLVDVSGSQSFGTRERTMRELATEIAATIAFSAIQNNDKIGVIFFSDRIEGYVPPQKGRKHILCIIRELLDMNPHSHRTDISGAIEYLMRVQKRRCIAFILSDFVDSHDYTAPLQIASRRHEIVAVRLYDRCMSELPNVGLMKVVDAETGHEQYVDTSSRKIRESHRAWWLAEERRLKQTLRKNGVDEVSVTTDGDYVRALMNLFSNRSKTTGAKVPV